MSKHYDLTEYTGRLYAAALKKTGDSHAAEDIVQETLLAAFISLSRGTEPECLWSWLARIESNKYYDWLRDKYQRAHISIEEVPFEIAQEPPLADESAEQLEAIRRELRYLARTHREILIRYYMRGETVEAIARGLRISPGTVKSRLFTGRRNIRKGVMEMEHYAKQSYEPECLEMACTGKLGYNGEPFSLVREEDSVTQNILILAYRKPVAEMELAKALGVGTAFVEPLVEKLVRSELMRRTDGGKVYTDFILYTEKDKNATFRSQLKIADEQFERFWGESDKALARLREKEYYKRLPKRAKSSLELHLCIKLLLNACIGVKNHIAGTEVTEYPYRQNGGRWIAMGILRRQMPDCERYEINGEAGCTVKNFRGVRSLELHKYNTALGRYPDCYFRAEYMKWMYELASDIPSEESAVDDYIFEAAGDLIQHGILIRDGSLKLNIPVLTSAEYRDECLLAAEHEKQLTPDIHDILLPLFEAGRVRLPAHLKSVPGWLTYQFCADSVPMAVIYKAIEKGLFLSDAGDELPAAILVLDQE